MNMNTAITPAQGGVCAPKGFRAAGMHCGIAKSPDKKDLALIASQVPCACAAVFTTNRVKAAPVTVTMGHLADGRAQAIVCNSGNANACNGNGEAVAKAMCKAAAAQLGISPEDVVVASTGVIGEPLDPAPIEAALPALASSLSGEGAGSASCVQAIMTTDTLPKETALRFQVGDAVCHLGGISKGSGMIHPNMATMLAFLTTDLDIAPELLREALGQVVKDSFNMISVDGDTSTNDMAVILANGMAGNAPVREKGPAYDLFVEALSQACTYLARLMAKDGEGATKLLECAVSGASGEACARALAKSVVSSSLVKAAMYGEDANWGRILCAMGYAGVDFDPSSVEVSFASGEGAVTVCQKGVGVPFSEEDASRILSRDEIKIQIDLHQGEGKATAWGCDLTHDYVTINGDYRS